MPHCQQSEEPTQLAATPVKSPPKASHSVQLPPTPSLTITSFQGEDDGTCALPPEEQVSDGILTLRLKRVSDSVLAGELRIPW